MANTTFSTARFDLKWVSKPFPKTLQQVLLQKLLRLAMDLLVQVSDGNVTLTNATHSGRILPTFQTWSR